MGEACLRQKFERVLSSRGEGRSRSDRSKDGTSFSAGGGDEGRRRFGEGAAVSDMCVGKGARWFCRLPLLGAVSIQLPNSVEVGCCIQKLENILAA